MVSILTAIWKELFTCFLYQQIEMRIYYIYWKDISSEFHKDNSHIERHKRNKVYKLSENLYNRYTLLPIFDTRAHYHKQFISNFQKYLSLTDWPIFSIKSQSYALRFTYSVSDGFKSCGVVWFQQFLDLRWNTLKALFFEHFYFDNVMKLVKW